MMPVYCTIATSIMFVDPQPYVCKFLLEQQEIAFWTWELAGDDQIALAIKVNFEMQQAILSVCIGKGHQLLQMDLQGLRHSWQPSHHVGPHSFHFLWLCSEG